MKRTKKPTRDELTGVDGGQRPNRFASDGEDITFDDDEPPTSRFIGDGSGITIMWEKGHPNYVAGTDAFKQNRYPSDRMKYTGEKNSKGEPHGQGTVTLPDGATYSGEWEDGEWNGRGTFTDENGTYTGGWKDMLRDGQGTETYKDGTTYTGEWKGGEWNGHGSMKDGDGTTYIGEFKDNVASGRGIETDAEGNAYTGEFKHGKRHGQGTFV